MPTKTHFPQTIARNSVPRRRSIADFLAPIERLARQSENVVINRGATFECNGESYELPRIHFIGRQGGGARSHIGIFAAIHGDEPESAHALIYFIELLATNPELATGYSLSLYPICNPTGFEDNTRRSRAGHDLNQEFWKGSGASEVRLLESELTANKFDGIIALHAHDSDSGLYGSTRGVTLTKHLLEPALKAAADFLPRNFEPVIDGHAAKNGIVPELTPGALSASQKSRPRPFEINLEIPKFAPSYLKGYAVVVALQTILAEYQKLISYAQGI